MNQWPYSFTFLKFTTNIYNVRLNYFFLFILYCKHDMRYFLIFETKFYFWFFSFECLETNSLKWYCLEWVLCINTICIQRDKALNINDSILYYHLFIFICSLYTIRNLVSLSIKAFDELVALTFVYSSHLIWLFVIVFEINLNGRVWTSDNLPLTCLQPCVYICIYP